MKLHFVLSLIAGCGLIASGAAHAGVSINIGNAAPAFFAPAPAVAEAPGWHGDRYYDGHRMWERRDWEAHQRMAHDHRDGRHDERRDEHIGHDADHRDDHIPNDAGHQDHAAFHHQG